MHTVHDLQTLQIQLVQNIFITLDLQNVNDNLLTVCSLDREAVRRYEELSQIFSDKDNYSQSRELLKEVSFCQNTA